MRFRDLLAIIAVSMAAPAYAQDEINPNSADMLEPGDGAEPDRAVDPEEHVGAAIKVNHDRNDGAVNLGAGSFIWTPEVAPSGLVRIVVSLSKQRAYVYRGSIRIGVSTVSTGRRGYRTPTGVFPILQKHRFHRSNRYNNAPMPYMQRLTWDGVAFHAGHVPSSPASHGCVRLPHAFAKLLYAATYLGTVVVIED